MADTTGSQTGSEEELINPADVARPPADMQTIIDKTVGFVLKSGMQVETRLKATNKPAFAFLRSGHPFELFYRWRLQCERNPKAKALAEEFDRRQKEEEERLMDATKSSLYVASSSGRTGTDASSALHTPQTATDGTGHSSASDGTSGAASSSSSSSSSSAAGTGVSSSSATGVGGSMVSGSGIKTSSVKVVRLSLKQRIEQELALKKKANDEHIRQLPLLPFVVPQPADISALNLDVIKLTAQFTACIGRSFVRDLLREEKDNELYGFLSPVHPDFQYFTRMVEAYRDIVKNYDDIHRGNDDFVKHFEKISLDPDLTLAEIIGAAEWEERRRARMALDEGGEGERGRHGGSYRGSGDSMSETERMMVASIDWDNFVVLDQVDFLDSDIDGLIAAASDIKEIDAILEAAEEALAASNAVSAAAASSSSNSNPGNLAGSGSRSSNNSSGVDGSATISQSDPRTDASTQPVRSQIEMAMDDALVADDMDMDDSSDDIEMEDVVVPKRVTSTIAGGVVTQSDLDKVPRMESGEDRTLRLQLEKLLSQSREETMLKQKCPVCSEMIVISKLSEHIKIELLNPKWKEQKELLRLKLRQSAFADNSQIAESLGAMAVKQKTLRDEAMAKSAADSGIDSKTKNGGNSSNSIPGNNVGNVESKKPSQPDVLGAAAQQQTTSMMPQSLPAVPPVMPIPMQNPLLMQPPMQSSVGLPIPGMFPPTMNPFIPPVPSMIANAMPAPKRQRTEPDDAVIPPSLSSAVQSTSSSMAPSGDTSAMGDASVSLNPADLQVDSKPYSFVSEEEWTANNPGKVTVKVRVPQDSRKVKWKFHGQLLKFTMDMNEDISVLRERIESVVGIPATHQNLREQSYGYFLKKEGSLARWNVNNQTTLLLLEKARAGRNKRTLAQTQE